MTSTFDLEVLGARHWGESEYAGRFEDGVGLDTFDELLANRPMFEAATCLLRSADGQNRRIGSPEEAMEGLGEGMTLQVRNLQLLLPTEDAAGLFAARIARETGATLDSITLFVTPANTRAIARHADPTEIVTLQLHGTKRWTLEPDPSGTNLSDSFVLEPGMALYVPAGTSHEVAGEADISISLALVFRPIRCLSILDILREHAVAGPLLRQTLSVGPDGRLRPRSVRSLNAAIAGIEGALGGLEKAMARELAEKHLSSSSSGPLSLRRLTTYLAPDSFLQFVDGVVTSLNFEADRIEAITTNGLRILMPVFVEDELRFMQGATEPFRLVDVPGALSIDERLVLARRLLEIGALSVVGAR